MADQIPSKVPFCRVVPVIHLLTAVPDLYAETLLSYVVAVKIGNLDMIGAERFHKVLGDGRIETDQPDLHPAVAIDKQ